MMVLDPAKDAAPETAPPSGWALVVDDHPLFCDALELTLRSVAAFTDVTVAGSLGQALDRLDAAPAPALVLLDLNLPDVSGLDGLIKLKRHLKQDAPVVIVSSMIDNTLISNALTAGASGYVPKHSRRSVFKDALAAIGRGEIYTPTGYVEPDAAQGEDTPVSRLASLTNQQARILDLICEGKLNKQIAYDLSIAETTVKAHVTAIMRKLGVQSRTQAVLVAREARFDDILPRSEQSP